MTKYSSSFFDEIICRNGSNSFKYDAPETVFGEPDVLPMWVADMDFRIPEEVSQAVKERAAHDIYGYTFHSPGFFRSAIDWMQRRHNRTINPDLISFSPGIVAALNLCVLAYTEPGDKVIVQSPVYPPFYTAISDHGRKILRNPLAKNGDYYEPDFDRLEKTIDRRTKMLILCQPHNPVGRVWNKAELEQLAEICIRHKLVVVSDMIHADLILDGKPCPAYEDVSPEAAAQTISLIAPSKTFNIAGLSSSLVYGSNPELKEKFDRIIGGLHINSGNLFGTTALEAAYNHGDAWLDALLVYLNANFDIVDEWTAKSPYVKYCRPEGTFLAWLDFSPSGLSGNELYDLIIRKAKVGLNKGTEFGREGKSFMRMNVGCPASIVHEAIRRIDAVMK